MTDLPTMIHLTEERIDFDQVMEEITLPTTGAVVIFSGTVREITTRSERQTYYLEYEAYEDMALSKMNQIADEIREKWPAVLGISIVHRVGTLYPGTPTVLIACSAAHRDTGVFEAARYGIDRLKQIVTIWKKEVGPKGEEWIEGNYQPKPGE